MTAGNLREVTVLVPRDEGEAWLESWDRQQELYLPDREERLGFLTGMVVLARAGERLRVLDLACGPGSLTRRLLSGAPDTHIVAVDFDPVLLSVYRSVHPGVHTVESDLRRNGWARSITPEFDAIVTATALHWLDGPAIRRLYVDLAALLRPGGVFLNADHLPLNDCPELSRRAALVLQHERDALGGGRLDWDAWWDAVAHDSRLGALVQERNRRFADRGDEFTPAVGWHLSALREAGFVEQAVVWRRGRDAIVAAVR